MPREAKLHPGACHWSTQHVVDHSGNDDGDDGDTEHRTPASSILILYKSLDGCSSNRYNDPHFQEEETEAQRSELAFSSPHSQQAGQLVQTLEVGSPPECPTWVPSCLWDRSWVQVCWWLPAEMLRDTLDGATSAIPGGWDQGQGCQDFSRDWGSLDRVLCNPRSLSKACEDWSSPHRLC